MLNFASMILLDSNSNADAIACMDAKLFHNYIIAALPVFARSRDCEFWS